MKSKWFAIGAILAALAVILGAFGAHALEARLSAERLATFEVAVRYQMYHALALFAVAWAGDRRSSVWVATAGWLFVAGTLVFSGSLYLLVFSGVNGLGMITPLGGLCLILGWLSLAASTLGKH